MKRTGVFALLALALSLLAGAATAAPVTGAGRLSAMAGDSPLVQRVHGCHRAPAIGPEKGECHVHRSTSYSDCVYYAVPMYQCRGGYRGPRYYEPRPLRCWDECHWYRGDRVCRRICR